MSELRDIRKALGVTQQELADRLDVSRRVVCANETGKLPTPVERIYASRYLLADKKGHSALREVLAAR